MAFIKRVQPIPQPVAQNDGLPADHFRNRRVLTLRVPRDVNASTKRNRPGVQALGEGGFTGADNACKHHIRCGDQAPLVQHPRVIHETATRVEILTHKHAIRAEPTFGKERIRTRQRSGGVLVSQETEPARCGKCRRAVFTRGREIAGIATFNTFSVCARFGFGSSCPAFFGVESSGGIAAGFAVLAAFPFWAEEHGRVQAFISVAVHSPSPRARTTALIRAGRKGWANASSRPEGTLGAWRAGRSSGRAGAMSASTPSISLLVSVSRMVLRSRLT